MAVDEDAALILGVDYFEAWCGWGQAQLDWSVGRHAAW
jgi:hypothetical protein